MATYPSRQNSARKERGPIINFSRFSMWGPMGDNRRAQLVFGIQDGNPRFTVFYPKKDGDSKTPSATAALGLSDTLAFLGMCLDFMKRSNNSDTFLEIENLRNTYEQGSDRPTGRTPSTALFFGRNDEGMYYFKITDMQYPKPEVYFVFDRSDWHVFKAKTPDGIKPITKSTMSQLMAEAMLTGIKDVILRINTPAQAGVGVSNPAEPIDNALHGQPVKVVHEDMPY